MSIVQKWIHDEKNDGINTPYSAYVDRFKGKQKIWSTAPGVDLQATINIDRTRRGSDGDINTQVDIGCSLLLAFGQLKIVGHWG